MRSLIGACALLMSMAPIAHSQTRDKGAFLVAGGALLPRGDLAADLDPGFAIQVGASVHRRNWPVDIRADGFYAVNAIKTEACIDCGNYTTYAFTLNGEWPASSSAGLHPFVIGGAGVYVSSVDEFNLSTGTKPGVSAGAGIKFRATRVVLFAEARYHQVFGESGTKPALLPIVAGVMF